MKKALSLFFIFLFDSEVYCQKNVFNYVNNFPIDSLSKEQLTIYNKITKSNNYSNIKFIKVNYIKEVAKGGKLILPLIIDKKENTVILNAES